MPVNEALFEQIKTYLNEKGAILVAVSKTKPVADIEGLYHLGQRAFGENYVQELTEKQPQLPADIQWHFIGHLQRNKVKLIVPFVHLIQSVDSFKLLQAINKAAKESNKIVSCLLQVHIAQEETKYGFSSEELMAAIEEIKKENLPNVSVKGLMGMASFTENLQQVKVEFEQLKSLFDQCKALLGADCTILSMGMSSDYEEALKAGSNMVRIGSLLFGSRENKA